MSRSNILYNFIVFLVYLFVQVFLFDNMVLFGTAFCFIYIGFILMMPIQMSPVLLILIAFISGFIVDIFYNIPGVNAASSVLIAFLRPFWLSMITPRGGYEDVEVPVLKTMGKSWFITYALPLIIVHHLALFTIEAGELANFWFIINKTFFSSIYTFVILVLGQYLFYARVRVI